MIKRKIYSSPHFNPDKLDKNNINRMTVEGIPRDSRILEIGCATGDIGEYLKSKKSCEVIGIEFDRYQAALAEKKLKKVIRGNIEDVKIINHLKSSYKSFDIILAMAVIEHLVKPEDTLLQIKKLMRKDSRILITLPNVSHWSIRWNLLRGKFDYEDYGIMDKTHLHFYTITTARQMIESSGYQIIEIKKDTVGGGYPRISRVLSSIFPNLFTYQMLIIAKVI